MGKGGLFLTFLVFVVLLAAGWYVLSPGDSTVPDRPGEEPSRPDAAPGEPGAEAPDALNPRRVRVVGLVFDRRTGKPIEGARVEFGDDTDTDDDRPLTENAVTSGNGEWEASFTVAPTVRRVVATGRVTAEGYFPWRIAIRIRPWETTHRAYPVRLNPAAVRVRGRVLYADGTPVAGARVGDTVTDETGRYGPVTVGSGTLTAVKTGWPYGVLRFTVEPGPFRDIERDIYLPVSTPFTGTVLDDHAVPLAGASVWIHDPEPTVTGEDGSFSFPGANGERWQLRVTREGWRPKSVWIVAGRPLTVRLTRCGVLAGRLLKEDGTAAGPGYLISLRGRFDAVNLYEVTTDDAGRFRMTFPSGGAVEIEVLRRRVACGSFVVDVPEGETVTREFTLLSPQPFAIRVISAETEEPLAGAAVFGGWPGPRTTRTAADGRAEVPFPPARIATQGLAFLVSLDGYLPETLGIPSTESSSGEARPVKLLTRSSIRVTVLDAGDRPVPGATVEVHVAEPRRKYATHTGADGRVDAVAPAGRLVLVAALGGGLGSATVNATAPADVTLRLTAPATAAPRTIRVMASEEEPLEGAWVQGSDRKVVPVGKDGRVEIPGAVDWVHVMAPGRATRFVDLEAVDPEEDLVLSLEPGRDLLVTVTDSGGRPVRDARVHVTAEMNQSIPVPPVNSDSGGKALLRGLPGDRAVFVTAKRYSFTDARAWVAAGAVEADLRLSRWSEILVHLGGTGLRAGQSFAWRWRTLDSAPLDEAFGQSRSRWVPDDSGVVRIPAPPGRLALLFECAGAAPRVYPEVVVPETRPGEVVYDFPEPGRVMLTVRDEDDDYVEAARLFVPGLAWPFAWTTARGKIPTEKRGRVPAGRVRLAIAAEGFATVLTEPIDLSAAESITLTLPKGSEVEGVLVTGEGRPVPGRVWVLTHVDQPGQFDEAGDDGRFAITRRLAPGEHRVRIQARGFPPVLRTIRITGGAKNRLELRVE